MTTIGIIGAGNIGSQLARLAVQHGHQVVIANSRGPETLQDLVAELGDDARAATRDEASAAGEIVVLAVPYAGQQALAQDVAAQLDGKILIDVTVPLVPPKVARVQLPEGGSAVEALQRTLGAGVRVVAAFQNVSAHQLADLDREVNCDVLVAGDDIEARETVCQLAKAIGITALHAGPLANSAAAEALTSVLIAINKRYKVADGAGIRITGIPDLA